MSTGFAMSLPSWRTRPALRSGLAPRQRREPALGLQPWRAEPPIRRQLHRGNSLLATVRRCFASTLLSVVACSATGPVDVPQQGTADAGPFALSGYVLKAPVSGASVTAYKLDAALTRGDALGTSTTTDDGFYGLTLPPYNGDVLLVATGGTYAEEALPANDQGNPRRLAFDREIPPWGKVMFHVFATLYFGLNLGAGAFLFTTRENFLAAGGFDEVYFAGEEVFFTVALKRLGRFKLLREPAITSGRKLRMYSGWKVFGGLFSVLFGGPRGVMSRKKLDMWYGGEREKPIS